MQPSAIWFPLNCVFIGVAMSGLAALGIGWWLRRTRAGYGLALQGGGVGILYLVIFAAAKLYNFLPMTLSLTVMIGLVALSGMLAVLQEAKSLAVFGTAGGFLAPVLMTTGGGSHVMLFSYYALLNAGILGIAWFKSWRELNLVGFIFTFAIGTLWGSTGYQPEHFASTEPFLVLFFVFYVSHFNPLCPSSADQSPGVYRWAAGLWSAVDCVRTAVFSGQGPAIWYGLFCLAARLVLSGPGDFFMA